MTAHGAMSTKRVTVQLRPSTTSASASSSSSNRLRVFNSLSSATSSPLVSPGVTSAPSTSSSLPVSFAGASSSASASARQVAAALQQDPSIFQYDEAVEHANSQRSRDGVGGSSLTGGSTAAPLGSSAATPAVRPASRYIGSLIKAATDRQAHRAVVQQLSRQKEIEQEEQMEEFRGKERFITAAYKQQLQQQSELTQPTPQQPRQKQRSDSADVEPSGGSSAQDESDRAAAASTGELDEPSAKRRRTQRETVQAAVTDTDKAADDSSEQRQQHSWNGSGPTSATAAPTPLLVSVPSSVIHSGSGVGGGAEEAEAEEARKRAAARDRFLARKKAAAQSGSDG